ncbi:hypothetical protein ACH5RR_017838 [Cinchona calisaya]|uniref:Uncharacterized protein n=1 Tax=Cinchona calisaya TaxID=153742 RepID=A0ABD2ZJQ7_9GENT
MIQPMNSSCYPKPGVEDSFKWKADQSRIFTIKSAVKLLIDEGIEVGIIWFCLNIIYLGMPLSYGCYIRLDYQPKIGCLNGESLMIHGVLYAAGKQNPWTTYSSFVIILPIFGQEFNTLPPI